MTGLSETTSEKASDFCERLKVFVGTPDVSRSFFAAHCVVVITKLIVVTHKEEEEEFGADCGPGLAWQESL